MSAITRLEQSLSTACEQGAMCVHDRVGHGLSAIRLRLAIATPSGWNDAIVLDANADGWIRLTRVEDGATVSVWHHADLTDRVHAGEPVALHARYDVLAVTGGYVNVAG